VDALGAAGRPTGARSSTGAGGRDVAQPAIAHANPSISATRARAVPLAQLLRARAARVEGRSMGSQAIDGSIDAGF
jgi:hypothetical protein